MLKIVRDPPGVWKPSEECGLAVLNNTTKERPQDRGTQVSLSMASLGRALCSRYEVIEKADREVFRCSLSGHASDRWLEVPAWMFDRAVCTAWRIAAAPHVDPRTLGVLVTLLQDATANSHTPSQLEDSGAASGPHDANRGEVHAAPAYDISVRSVSNPHDAQTAQMPPWQALPEETRLTLTKLMVRLILDHVDGDRTVPLEDARHDA
ncbi:MULTISPECIES: hypothetical protein [unclassified Mesorhizobium]|nr:MULTISPECIES: hypothetical protein [unclassified Mesorhizobium]